MPEPSSWTRDRLVRHHDGQAKGYKLIDQEAQFEHEEFQSETAPRINAKFPFLSSKSVRLRITSTDLMVEVKWNFLFENIFKCSNCHIVHV